MKLFGVYLGGMVEGCNIEVHDFVFAIGGSIEETYDFLKSRWFGLPKGLHMDSWVDLSTINGFKVNVIPANEKCDSAFKVYFVNLGGYDKNHFGEKHKDVFIVATSKAEARSIAKKEIEQKFDLPHVDFSYEVDECIEASGFTNYSIEVSKMEGCCDVKPLQFNNGYFKITNN
ncbi:MAG TPA: DUF1543 domain-containing protein [Gammaproteobacteria bacterium]|nr:hypothetical protein [Gammaproteobacteria bacterium]HBF06650.1 DUF1543 domain-containing protein [Gammaproteobacteria bacterium]HCK93051.1 DUF1543 domain-containing protein [Gammaproteobacteria bacterium]|tara:strand:+ start:1814 stop:2332 length:519 start_codon:yes stop_codon:yes gene_type:complete